jgi:ribonucleoside-diphosphate reductase alpha chain
MLESALLSPSWITSSLFETTLIESAPLAAVDPVKALTQVVQMEDAPPCLNSGSLMVRNGSCYRCVTCGSTSGCS